MIVVFANKKVTPKDVSDALSKVGGKFKVFAVKNKNGKIVSGCAKVVKIGKNGKPIDHDDEYVDYVRETLEDDLGEEILEIDDNDDIRFK